MKKHLIVFFAVLLAANLVAIGSKITSVTVYSDRALITRTATSHFDQGEQKIVFDNLPDNLDESSVQVSGKGNAVIRNVTVKTEQIATISNEQKKTLNDKLLQLQDQKSILQDALNLATDEKQVVKNILTKITSVTDESNTSSFNPENWMQMMDFYHNKNEAIDLDIRTKNIEIRNIDAEIAKVQRQIRNLGKDDAKAKKSVEVTADVTANDDLTLDLSYLVPGPHWQPSYDLRVDSNQKTMNITYKGNVYQATGEDWKDIDLKLSTARPSVGAQPPELTPQNLSIQKSQRYLAKSQPQQHGGMSNTIAYSIDGMSVAEDMAEAEIGYAGSSVSAGATSVVFSIDGS
ncbi:MAG TPA: mucoidy inhibitor MuiA family protein, partial [Candidatus Cloacimonadota bacterium]|nr:mucoidy inhibitor MuiA family protein [Candidatus Cloacimonadota bacterium]